MSDFRDEEQKQAIDIIRTYEDYRDQRVLWDKHASEDEDFAYGKQWTEKQKRKLLERGQAPLVINRVYPYVMQQIAMLNAKNISFRVTARDDGDVKVAKVGNDILSYVQDMNNWRQLYSKLLWDLIVKGLGYINVYKDIFNVFSPEVGMERLPPEWVYVDPMAVREDLYDAEHIFVSRMLTKSQFTRMNPDKAEVFDDLNKNWDNRYVAGGRHNALGIRKPVDIFDSKGERIRVIEDYTLEKERRVRQINTNTREMVLYKEDEWEEVKMNPMVRKAIDMGVYEIARVWVDVPYLTIYAGDRILREKVKLPGTKRPIIPFFNIHTETPYGVSDVRLIKDIQKEINKRRAILINHASLSASSPYWAQKGSIDNIEEMERKVSVSNSILEYNPGYEKPTREHPAALPNAVYTLEEMAKHDLEYTGGIFALSQGDSSAAPDTFRATLAIEEYGNRRIQLKQRQINQALTLLGQVVWEYIQEVYPANKIIRIAQPDGTETELKLNLVDRVDETAPRMLDLSVGHYDIQAVAGSTMASNRWAELSEYKELLQIGAIDLEEFLKKTDIFDREGILKRRSQLMQANQQIQQMADTLQGYEKQLNGLQSQLQQLTKKNVELEFKLSEAKRRQDGKE